MPLIPLEEHTRLTETLSQLRTDRYPFWNIWRELADYYLPSRYTWLMSPNERKRIITRNPNIINGVGTRAARTLAAGMMDGVTSRLRPWFRLKVRGVSRDELSHEANIWLDAVQEDMLLVMSGSNFYNALAVMYLDLAVFGTAAVLIYEDDESIIRCYNSALGEFYVGQSYRRQVDRFAREISLKVHQVERQFGLENLSIQSRAMFERSDPSGKYTDLEICHLIEPNTDRRLPVPERFPYREVYWEKGATRGQALSVRGFDDFPVIAPRWETTGNDAYGTSPAWDAFGDTVQLQHESKKKAQSLDKLVDPPVVADAQLKSKPVSLLPRGVTYVSSLSSQSPGVVPIRLATPPIGEISQDIAQVELRIRETFHNDLFRIISQLDTVRSATEIDSLREEKLVLLGPVLNRFENEALDPAISRIFSIMERRDLLPDPPPDIEGADLELQYISVLAVAQRAVNTAPTERWLELIANLAAVHPQALNVPNFEELIRGYGQDVGVPAAYIGSTEDVADRNAQSDEINTQREAEASGQVLVDSAKTLSDTNVGGGINALETILG